MVIIANAGTDDGLFWRLNNLESPRATTHRSLFKEEERRQRGTKGANGRVEWRGSVKECEWLVCEYLVRECWLLLLWFFCPLFFFLLFLKDNRFPSFLTST